jgi:hypothetical protein
MGYQPMNQPHSSPDALESAALDLDQRLTRALETAPELQIPADFAARVASQVPARPVVSLTQTHYGDYAMLLGILVTLAALFVFGLHTPDRHTFNLVETFLLTDFLGLTVWLSVRRHSLR